MPDAATTTIDQLRLLLAQKFPAPAPRHGTTFSTGIPGLDLALGGGLPGGMLTEISSTPGAPGCLTVFTAILAASARERRPVALVDGADGFDPTPLDAATLEHLLWVRCQEAGQCLEAADLILRDGNLPILLLDLRGLRPGVLKKIPNTTWYRFQRVAAQGSVACMVATPWLLVSGAHVRVRLCGRLGVGDLERPTAELLEAMDFEVTRRHGQAMPAAI